MSGNDLVHPSQQSPFVTHLNQAETLGDGPGSWSGAAASSLYTRLAA